MKRDRYLVLGAFLFGVVLANLADKELLTTYGILNTYFLEQYAYSSIRPERLFWQVLFDRLSAALVFLTLGKLMRARMWLCLTVCFLAGAFGFLTAAAVINLGAKGVLIMLCGGFPQWLCYAAAIFIYAGAKQRSEAYPVHYGPFGAKLQGIYGKTAACLLAAVLMLLGVFLESYVNPALFAYVL